MDYTRCDTEKSKNIFQIIIGQYLGLGILIILSILGSIGTHFFPGKCIGLWGFLPLFLGLRTLILYCGKKSDEDFQHTMQIPLHIPMIMFLTLSNGADNIAVYIPLFSSCTASETTISLVLPWISAFHTSTPETAYLKIPEYTCSVYPYFSWNFYFIKKLFLIHQTKLPQNR